jgi:RNA recognition motif-containing protein
MAFEQAVSVNSNNVFVGNLAWATTGDKLREHFADCGNVVNAEVKMGRDGRSRGCGVVEFDSPQGAQAAMTTLNESELDGRQIFVREDRETPKPASKVANGRRLFVSNLAWSTTAENLQEHMAQGGGVSSASIMVNESNGRSKGYGIVEMATLQDAQNAIQTLNNTELNGRQIFVREDQKA